MHIVNNAKLVGWGDGGGVGGETRGKGGGARRGWDGGMVQIRGRGRKTREGREEGRGGGGRGRAGDWCVGV